MLETSIGRADARMRRAIRVGRLLAGGLVLAGSAVAARELLTIEGLGHSLRELAGAPLLLVAFLLTYTAAFWLRAMAWRELLRGRVRTWSLHAILQASLTLNHLLPVKAGEVARPMLTASEGVPLSAGATTTVVARLLDVAALAVLVLAFAPLAATSGPGAAQVLPVVALLGMATASLVLLRSRVALPLPGAVDRIIQRVREALRTIRPRDLGIAFAVTLPSWVLEGAALYVVAQAAGADIPLHVAIGATAFTILFQAFHVTPGGLGIYEASMTAALVFHGLAVDEAAMLATATHVLKFGYAFTVAPAFALALPAVRARISPLGALRGSATAVKGATRFEIVMARLWNIVNEGKPFTPVFVIGIALLLALPHAADAHYWVRWALAMGLIAPLAVIFYRFDFPLRLRTALWLMLAIFVALFRYLDWTAIAVMLGAYFTFTVVIWGSVYYHLRIGMPLTNFTRFWRLVLENPDPTSGNFLEQAPKCLLLILGHQLLMGDTSTGTVSLWMGFTAVAGLATVLIHQWFFTWPPAPSLVPTLARNDGGERISERVIVIAIDGCRADRLREAVTPCIDRLRAEGTEFTNMRTVYPARTVTCFSSMLTGAPPRRHGMRSNFVPSLGVKCESIFDVLRSRGLLGRLVGIAHLIDAFGEKDVRSVTAVTHNDEIDAALVEQAKRVLEEDDPDLLVLQLLSVDQTGHARGSYNAEYLDKIEETDRTIEQFLAWCRERGYLDGTTVMVTADHGQGIGIGGHGHLSPSELYIPCILWGQGIAQGRAHHEPRSIMDIAATVAYILGAAPPEASVGQVLLGDATASAASDRPLAVIVPARNEEENLPGVLAGIPRGAIAPVQVIVVDDGSIDSTVAAARAGGADIIVSHEQSRGLGAALRTGLERARAINARAAVYLDGDGEYDPREIPQVLDLIERQEADYVVGSRYLGRREGQKWHRALANHGFTILLSVLAGRRLTDGQSGFRAFSRDALEVAEIIHDYNYAQVLTLDLLQKGMRLREVPITYRRRQAGRSFVRAGYLWRVPVGITRELLGH